MECLLCTMWARMPYAKRHTTPTTAQETEGALIVGYWIASRQSSAPRLCEHHMNIITLLDDQEEERRLYAEKAAQMAQRIARERQMPEPIRQQVSELQERKQVIANAMPNAPQPVVAITPLQPPGGPSRLDSNGSFALGPGPLTNENTVTEAPPLPAAADPSAPYRTQIAAIAPTLQNPEMQSNESWDIPTAKPGTMEGAIEAALAPPVEGGKVVYPCPSCGKEVMTGDVHACNA